MPTFALTPPLPAHWWRCPPIAMSDVGWIGGALRQGAARIAASARGRPREIDGDDTALIRAVARQDARALETLYRRYAPRLGRYLWRMLQQRETVEEVLNDVMLVVAQKACTFDPDRAQLSTWMIGIAHHKALTALSRAARHGRVGRMADDDDDAGESVPATPQTCNPEHMLMGRQLGELLQWAMEQLSPDHKAVIELTFGEHRSYAEIAAICNCPLNTVKTRMFHARRHLGELLALHGIDDVAPAPAERTR
jgi:RNA polymerase sigma-70 factor, ECF subfamily